MAAVTDYFAVDVADSEGGAYEAGFSVVVGCHAVVYVGHAGCAVGYAQHGLFVGGGGVSYADYHACFSTVSGEGKVFVVFRCHGDVFNQSLVRPPGTF